MLKDIIHTGLDFKFQRTRVRIGIIVIGWRHQFDHFHIAIIIWLFVRALDLAGGSTFGLHARERNAVLSSHKSHAGRRAEAQDAVGIGLANAQIELIDFPFDRAKVNQQTRIRLATQGDFATKAMQGWVAGTTG